MEALMKLRKVGIIGTGHVGSHVAFSLALQGEVDELYMMDIDEKKAQAQAMDINDAVSYIPHQVTATSGPIEECGDCDIVRDLCQICIKIVSRVLVKP